MRYQALLRVTAWICAIIGVITIVLFLCSQPFNDWSWQPDASLFGMYGDFIGGFVGTIFSLAGFIFLYLTFRSQQESIKKQEEELKMQKLTFEQESFESTFFNLLNVQHNITNDLKAEFWTLYDVSVISKKQVFGREIFKMAIKERFLINESLSSKLYLDIYKEEFNEFI